MTAPEIRFSAAVEERADWPVDGGDITILSMTLPDVIVPAALSRLGLDIGEAMASGVDTLFHHGDFVITSNVETVRRWGWMPEHDGCERCEAGVANAIAKLEAEPTLTLVVGRLCWSSQPPQ